MKSEGVGVAATAVGSNDSSTGNACEAQLTRRGARGVMVCFHSQGWELRLQLQQWQQRQVL